MHAAVKNHPELVRKYFSRIYPPADHKYAALHYALWSGGVFLYVPPKEGLRGALYRGLFRTHVPRILIS